MDIFCNFGGFFPHLVTVFPVKNDWPTKNSLYISRCVILLLTNGFKMVFFQLSQVLYILLELTDRKHH